MKAAKTNGGGSVAGSSKRSGIGMAKIVSAWRENVMAAAKMAMAAAAYQSKRPAGAASGISGVMENGANK